MLRPVEVRESVRQVEKDVREAKALCRSGNEKYGEY